jgi:uncharacterized membrane protein YfcA
MDIKEAIPLVALFGLVNNTYLIIKLKAHVEYRELKSLIIGAVLGIPLGALFLSKAEPGLIEIILGIIILIFVLFTNFNLIKQKEISLNWGYMFGALSGLFGGAFNINGPPVLIYFYIMGWDKFKLKASITGFFIFSSITIVAMHIATGVTTQKVFFNFIYILPVVIAGMIIGYNLFHKVSTKLYNRIILIGLTIIAISMILR